jgi:outer membrane protein OmpA-like peptidoglycan-associated protein
MQRRGFKSGAMRKLEAERAESSKLAAQNEELQARLAALDAKNDTLETELAAAKSKPATVTVAAPAEPKPQPKTVEVAEPAPKPREDLVASFRQLIGPGVTPIKVQGRDGIRLGSDIVFDSGKTSVKASAKPVLQSVAKAIRSLGQPVTVYVDGHTDSDPLRRTKHLYGDNRGLGKARAEAVARELEGLGVPRTSVVTRSFGKEKPIADNKTRRGKQLNRRVEISLAPSS